jgi:hypothetical protein
MSTLLELLNTAAPEEVFEKEQADPPANDHPAGWNQEVFAQEQLQSLVRQIFFPGWSKSAKQVVFAAVDPHTQIDHTCVQIAGSLEAQTSGTICIVRADHLADPLGLACSTLQDFEQHGRTAPDPPSVQAKWDSLRQSSRQVSKKLWVMPREVFLDGSPGGRSAAWLHGRLEQMRTDFDYTLFQAAAAASSSDAALFGNLCDGVILVLEARFTRRLAAQRAKAMLHAANARLLGTVLTERTFPIPERIYRKL